MLGRRVNVLPTLLSLTGVAPNSRGLDVSTGSLGHLSRQKKKITFNGDLKIAGLINKTAAKYLQVSLSFWHCHREQSSAASLLSTGQDEEKKSGRRERCHSERPEGMKENIKYLTI